MSGIVQIATGTLASGDIGFPVVIRADSVLTNAYVGTTSVDLEGYNGVSIEVLVGTTQAKTCNIKFQWSRNDSNWMDERELDGGSISSTEIQHIPYTRVINLDISVAANNYIERFNRIFRWFRVAVKSDATTTGTISIRASKLRN